MRRRRRREDADRSRRPHSCPHRTPRRRERPPPACAWHAGGCPARIAHYLGMHLSTVHKILSRYGCVRPALTEPVRARRRRRPGARGHHKARPHPRRWRTHKVLGRGKGRKIRSGAGYWYVHNPVDDHSRLALLTDERQGTAAAFWLRAHAHFATAGITVRRVLTDNACYRSRVFADALGPEIGHTALGGASPAHRVPDLRGQKCGGCRRRRGGGGGG